MDRKNIKKTEKLYGALGELLYAVAKADGKIQNEEFQKLDELLQGHEWEETIKWSFRYEVKKNSDPEQVFQKVINHCETYGPAREYNEFLDLVSRVAEASHGIDEDERQVISSFSHDLVERFKKTIYKISAKKMR